MVWSILIHSVLIQCNMMRSPTVWISWSCLGWLRDVSGVHVVSLSVARLEWFGREKCVGLISRKVLQESFFAFSAPMSELGANLTSRCILSGSASSLSISSPVLLKSLVLAFKILPIFLIVGMRWYLDIVRHWGYGTCELILVVGLNCIIGF